MSVSGFSWTVCKSALRSRQITTPAPHPRARQVQSGSRCPGRRLSTRPTTGVSCPTALGALCGQLTFRLAWCRQHSAVMATELLQPRDLACGTLFQSSCVILTSPTDCYDDSWRDTFFGKHEHGALWFLICGAIENTYLLTYYSNITACDRQTER